MRKFFLEINQIYFCTGPTSDGSAAAIIVSEDFVKSRGLEDRVKPILISISILIPILIFYVIAQKIILIGS